MGERASLQQYNRLCKHRITGSVVKSVSSEQQQLDQVSRDISAGDVQASRQVRKSKAFVDGTNVSDAVAGVDDDTGQKSLCVERQNGLKKTTLVIRNQ
jgi:hypothetical protein